MNEVPGSVGIGRITDVEELERKIAEYEKLLTQSEGKWAGGWLPLLISIGLVIATAIKIPRGGMGYVAITGICLVYLAFNVWRLFSAYNQKKEIESQLKGYRDRKAGLQGPKPAPGNSEGAGNR